MIPGAFGIAFAALVVLTIACCLMRARDLQRAVDAAE